MKRSPGWDSEREQQTPLEGQQGRRVHNNIAFIEAQALAAGWVAVRDEEQIGSLRA
jgi:hypothetical protein